jgi:hypothetical protein
MNGVVDAINSTAPAESTTVKRLNVSGRTVHLAEPVFSFKELVGLITHST